MTYEVSITTAQPVPAAVVAASVDMAEFPALWKPMLDDVWAFLRADGESPRKAGHNVMVYRDGAGGLVDVEVGVQVDAPFERAGRVVASATPSGPAARTVHRGSPEGIGAAHDAVVAWCAEHGHRLTRTRWEVYGDWTADPADFETEVCWLLA